MTVHPSDAYHYYSPLPPKLSGSSYRNYLYKLGFKPEQAELGFNHRLIKDLKVYLEGNEYFHLRKCDNPAAFRTLVLEFLEEQGPRYWGHSKRQHLDEEDPSKGYLYPRDVQRGESP